jgi:hypothetical protein
LLTKVDNEGYSILTLSELLQLKAFNNERINGDNNEQQDRKFCMLKEAFEKEKNSLVLENFEMRELLSKFSVISL